MFRGNFFVLHPYSETLVKLMEFHLAGRMIKKTIEMETFCPEVLRKAGLGARRGSARTPP